MRKIELELDDALIERAQREESYVVVICTFDPRAESFRWSIGNSDPASAKRFHDLIDKTVDGGRDA